MSGNHVHLVNLSAKAVAPVVAPILNAHIGNAERLQARSMSAFLVAFPNAFAAFYWSVVVGPRGCVEARHLTSDLQSVTLIHMA